MKDRACRHALDVEDGECLLPRLTGVDDEGKVVTMRERDLPGESARLVGRLAGLPDAARDEAIRVVRNLLEARLRLLHPLVLPC